MPIIRRFLNADIPDIAQQSKDEENGLNLFAYCNNDPVNYSDPTGYVSNTSRGGFISELLAAIGFAKRFYFDSRKKNKEFGALIYRYTALNRLWFAYTAYTVGTSHSVDPFRYCKKYVPNRATITANIHTHPSSDYKTAKFISSGDTMYAVTHHINSYVVISTEELKYFYYYNSSKIHSIHYRFQYFVM